MLYNSLGFAAYLAAVAVVYHVCPRSWRPCTLLVASYAFYCSWSPPLAVLLGGVTWVAFRFGRRLGEVDGDAARRRVLRRAVVVVLVPLVAFKYLPELDTVVGGSVAQTSWGGALVTQLVTAVGISYYTLKLISYLADVYWQRLPPCRDFVSLATYAAFFPQILSGPIQRAGDFLTQVDPTRAAGAPLVVSGLRLILFGLFKKLVVADRLGVVVDQVFAQPHAFSGEAVTLAAYLFTLQLYADFSGLTDVAIGCGRLVGISAPPNFDCPLYADNIQEFWRRWHMTLTSWLGDYIFTPLRMKLRDWAQVGLVLSLAANMMAVGLWHGALWTFVVFGAVHAGYMIASSLTLRARRRVWKRHPWMGTVHGAVGPLITFNLVVLSLVLFRAASLSDAWYVISTTMTTWPHLIATPSFAGAGAVATAALRWDAGDVVIAGGGVGIMECIHWVRRSPGWTRAVRRRGWARWVGYVVLGFGLLLWGDSGSNQFIYVRF